ncbi:peptide ABC transporter substrate-binding protein [Enterococcus sp. JM9B]|uniref:peptide ABC transporter substrate-binding protein n=1 Tax=Enterococcus sp. JM9B TaxID=1857216 RepID=UPI001374ADF1|nr:peptide ABC transporter substrate-binding protein [Enterococcus sp. JM9B]KAF1300991.1 peptide ABC transporter substrate-binding protein [Enterococcus sp. JM9B]
MSRKGIWAKVIVSGVIGTLFLAGCGQKKEAGKDKKSEQIFSQTVPTELTSADLSVVTDTISFGILNNTNEGIYRLDKDNNPQPAGAKEMAEVSTDGRTYTIHLRDTNWSNGDPVKAGDYVYGWQRTVDPKMASQYAFMFSSVKNADAINQGKAELDTLGIKALDDTTLEIQLEQATPYFPYLLAFPSFFPQNKGVIEEYGDQYAATSEKLVSNGPFVLTDFDGPGVDTDWTLKKNKEYWDADTVQLTEINYTVVKEASTALNLFNDGQAEDVTLNGELARQKANDPEYVSLPIASTTYLEFNQATPDSPFKNSNVRKAISYALDRKSIVTNILGNGSIASTGFVPSGMSLNPETKTDFTEDTKATLSYDEKQAQTYWEKAKSELGIEKLSFKLLSSDVDSTKKITEYIKGQLEEKLPGITIDLNPVPISVRLERANSGNFEVVMNNWVADYADPSSFLDLFVTGSPYNRGDYSSKAYDKAVESASLADATDEAARWQDLLTADQILNEDMGIVPIYQSTEAHLRSEKIKGIVTHAAGAQYDYKWAYVE